MAQTTMASRTEVREVACPACNAPRYAKCVGLRGEPREQNHLERGHAWEKATGRKTGYGRPLRRPRGPKAGA